MSHDADKSDSAAVSKTPNASKGANRRIVRARGMLQRLCASRNFHPVAGTIARVSSARAWGEGHRRLFDATAPGVIRAWREA